ncbi:MAG: Uma2 family endonuclease [Planctomycetaceae bacterium]|nr:MAG: Uma2 family endonuclease [Planctomycetaceae bacterium]
MRLGRLLSNFIDDAGLGWLISDTASYRCFPEDPDQIRRQDLTFVRAGRFLNDVPPDSGFCEIPPDLAVEVVSPNDTFYEISARVADFLSVGTALVWVVDPAHSTVAVHYPDRPGKTLRASDALTGDDVLPGLRCRVADLFPPKASRAGGPV